jgi:hypothetical protein
MNMNGYHGPVLTYIARNEQRQKLEAAAQARLAMSARADANQCPARIPGKHGAGAVARLRFLIRQCLTGLQGGGSPRHGARRQRRIEHSNVLGPRLSS